MNPAVDTCPVAAAVALEQAARRAYRAEWDAFRATYTDWSADAQACHTAAKLAYRRAAVDAENARHALTTSEQVRFWAALDAAAPFVGLEQLAADPEGLEQLDAREREAREHQLQHGAQVAA